MPQSKITRRSAVSILAALAAVPTLGRTQGLTKVRVASTPFDIAAQAYFALDLGLFRQAGLDVDLTSFRPPAILPAVVGGAVDIGSNSSIGMFTARERDVPFALIAEAGMYSSRFPSTAIMVGKNSPLNTASDLNGKKFGTESLMNLSTLGAWAWGDKGGADYRSYKFIELISAEQGAALAAGRIDAGIVVEPFVSQAVAAGTARIIGRPFDAIAPEFCLGGWFCMSDYANANPDVIKRFSLVMDQAAKWANRNLAQAGAILQKYSHAAPTPAAYRTVFPERLDPLKMQVLIDVATRYGLLTKSHRVTEIIPPSLLTA
jgi:NitT/TauT family transport system substrate-binding protein